MLPHVLSLTVLPHVLCLTVLPPTPTALSSHNKRWNSSSQPGSPRFLPVSALDSEEKSIAPIKLILFCPSLSHVSTATALVTDLTRNPRGKSITTRPEISELLYASYCVYLTGSQFIIHLFITLSFVSLSGSHSAVLYPNTAPPLSSNMMIDGAGLASATLAKALMDRPSLSELYTTCTTNSQHCTAHNPSTAQHCTALHRTAAVCERHELGGESAISGGVVQWPSRDSAVVQWLNSGLWSSGSAVLWFNVSSTVLRSICVLACILWASLSL